jgi:rsbT co-antagonist protein RsbR
MVVNAMTTTTQNRISDILTRHSQLLLEQWLQEQMATFTVRNDLISEPELRQESTDFIKSLAKACQTGNLTNITTSEWIAVLQFLDTLSKSRARKGFTPTETASA